MREDFEKWASDIMCLTLERWATRPDDYRLRETDIAWESWKASRLNYDPASLVGVEAMPVTMPIDGSTRPADVSSGNSNKHTDDTTPLTGNEVLPIYTDKTSD
jgi:hypothetical protein